MNKRIIPRRDHEVYFILSPDAVKTKQEKSFVREQLERLHPGFSTDTLFDIHHFVFNSTRWIMVTVMEEAVLAEYRIVNKKTVFYTNTSIAAHKKEFIDEGFKTIDDECIGFDTDKNTPVSFPLDTDKNDTPPSLTPLLKSIPVRHGVFVKKPPFKYIVLISSAFLLMLAISLGILFFLKAPIETPPEEVYTEVTEETEILYLPSAIEILVQIASDIVESGGEIQKWQYDDENEPLMSIQLRNIDVLEAHGIYEQYEYVYLQDITEVNYRDGEPNITIHLDTRKELYTIPVAGIFPLQSSVLPIIRDLTNALQKENISIVSESLPSSGNGNDFYSITYAAHDRNFIRSLEIISNVCTTHPVRVKGMDVSLSGDKHQFTIICTLAYSDMPHDGGIVLVDRIEKIPLAFGFRNPPPPVPRVVKTQEVPPEPPAIGSIKGGSGNVIFYRDSADGKIKVRGKNE